MPIIVDAPVREISQDEFREISYDVMRQVFSVHNELGPYFDESIYQSIIAAELPGARTEVRIEVTLHDYRKE